MITEPLTASNDIISDGIDIVEDATLLAIEAYGDFFWKRATDLGLTNEENMEAYAYNMIFAVMMDIALKAPLDNLYNITHLNEDPVDNVLAAVVNALGLTYDIIDGVAKNASSSMLDAMTLATAKVDNYTRYLGVKLYSDMGITFGSAYEDIKALDVVTIKELDDRLKIVEAEEGILTEEQWKKIDFVNENAAAVIDSIDEAVGVILADVQEWIEPIVDNIVGDQLADFSERITIVETIVAQQESLIFFYLFKWIAEILMPQAGIQERAEEITATVEEWIDAQLDPIRADIEALQDGVPGEIEITEERIRQIVKEEVDNLEIGTGKAGPTGPPGERGPPGEKGEPGIPGEAGEGEFKLEEEILDIDEALSLRVREHLGEWDGVIHNTASMIISDNIVILSLLSDRIGTIQEFLTEEMMAALTGIAEAFETPEALIAFLLDVPEGQEDVTYDLWQLLVTEIFERGI